MSRFIGALLLRALAPVEVDALKSRVALFQTTEDFTFVSDKWGAITVPAGFVTDFASIPRGALWYIDDDDPGILFGSVIHDFIYGLSGRVSGSVQMSREDADVVLREAMAVCGASPDQIAVVYRVLRWFGGSHWGGK